MPFVDTECMHQKKITGFIMFKFSQTHLWKFSQDNSHPHQPPVLRGCTATANSSQISGFLPIQREFLSGLHMTD